MESAYNYTHPRAAAACDGYQRCIHMQKHKQSATAGLDKGIRVCFDPALLIHPCTHMQTQTQTHSLSAGSDPSISSFDPDQVLLQMILL